MEYEVGEHIDVVGTSLKSYLTVPKHILVELLGEPLFHGSDDKVINEWYLAITDEEGDHHVVTIYDWKTQSNGNLGPRFKDWHVGGRDHRAVEALRDLLIELSRRLPESVKYFPLNQNVL